MAIRSGTIGFGMAALAAAGLLAFGWWDAAHRADGLAPTGATAPDPENVGASGMSPSGSAERAVADADAEMPAGEVGSATSQSPDAPETQGQAAATESGAAFADRPASADGTSAQATIAGGDAALGDSRPGRGVPRDVEDGTRTRPAPGETDAEITASDESLDPETQRSEAEITVDRNEPGEVVMSDDAGSAAAVSPAGTGRDVARSATGEGAAPDGSEPGATTEPASGAPRVPAEVPGAVDTARAATRGETDTNGRAASDPSGGDVGSAGQATAPASQTAPELDLLRVDRDGIGLLAGRATPGETVEVLVDGARVSDVEADGSGQFAVLLDLPDPDAPRQVTVRARGPDGAPGATAPQTFIVQPRLPATRTGTVDALGSAAGLPAGPAAGSEPPADDAPSGSDRAAAAAHGGPVDATGDRPAAAPDLPDAPGATASPAGAPLGDGTAAEPAIVASSPAAGAAPRILRADDSGLSVLPGPGDDTDLSIDTISYDRAGEVVLGGRAEPESAVRVYLDNAPVEVARAGIDGQWRLELPELDARVYTLRVDRLTEGGGVAERAETPFRPELPAVVRARQADLGDAPISQVIVQPGYTLWAIAERNYGTGFDYVRVFEANDDKIRDPDLIYPGQVFDIPPAYTAEP